MNAHDGRRGLRSTQTIIIPRRRDRKTEQPRIFVHRPTDRRAENQELRIAPGCVARLEKVLAVVRTDGPVIVLSGAVHASKRFFVQKAYKPVSGRDLLQNLHHQHLMIQREVGGLECGREFVLPGSRLVVAGLDRNPQQHQLVFHLGHERQHPAGNRAEIVVVQLLPLGRSGTEQRPTHDHQIGPEHGQPPIDEEVFLLHAQRAFYAFGSRVPENL